MKKIILITASFGVFLGHVHAQRHLKGIRSIDALVGITKLGQYGELGYVQYLSNKSYVKGSVRGEAASFNSAQTKFNSYGLNLAYNYTLYNPFEFLFLNASAGGTLILDNIKQSQVEIAKKNSFNYGAFAGAEMEFFMGDKLVLIANFRQNYFFQKQLGHYVFYAGAGLRYNFR